ncbi:MAG: selenium cofactor biosynthesis protein YqeC [Acidimicrobiia bacterium]
MSPSLWETLGLGDRELVSLVGGGGKSTLLLTLGNEAAASGRRVIVTTTTKMGQNQVVLVPSVCWSPSVTEVERALDGPGPVMVLESGNEYRVIGPGPDVVDLWFEKTSVDLVVVEADGARRRPTKAPASYEPVIPSRTTTLVVVMGIDAVGRPVSEAALRPDLYAGLAGIGTGDLIETDHCIAVLGHRDGGIKSAPGTARVVVAITKVREDPEAEAAARIVAGLTGHPGIDDVVVMPFRARLHDRDRGARRPGRAGG